jgi:hypothetical protein
MTLFEIWYLISQYLIFFTGVIYAVFAYRQWRAIAEQAKIAADGLIETRKSADAAVQSAIASQMMTDAARKNFQLDMRAFVTVHFDHRFEPDTTDSRLIYTLKNSGKTWAFIKRIQTITWEGADWPTTRLSCFRYQTGSCQLKPFCRRARLLSGMLFCVECSQK